MQQETPETTSDSYRLPALDGEFLLSPSMRGVRFMMEYAKAEETLRARNIISTIVVFGSPRATPGDARYEAARTFARLASEQGGASHPRGGYHHNVIATGGGPGIMEAANRGASEAGAPTVGFNVATPNEYVLNPYVTQELTFLFHYFAMRKMHLAMRARALVVFPGGFGTLDELFEVLTLQQTAKMPRCPIVLYDKTYWTKLINFQHLIDEGYIDKADTELFRLVDTPQDAWEALIDLGLQPHLRKPGLPDGELAETSRVKRLFAATDDQQQQLEATIIAFDTFANRDRYGRFLQARHAFQRDLVALYADPKLNELIPGLSRGDRLPLIEQDLRDLDLKPMTFPEGGESARARSPDLPTALGWLYVSEGSKLGATLHLKWAEELGLSEIFGARHLAAAPEGRAHRWKTFAAAFDAVELSDEDEARAIDEARLAFARLDRLINMLLVQP